MPLGIGATGSSCIPLAHNHPHIPFAPFDISDNWLKITVSSKLFLKAQNAVKSGRDMTRVINISYFSLELSINGPNIELWQ